MDPVGSTYAGYALEDRVTGAGGTTRGSGVVRDGSLDLFSGHGLADMATRTPVTEDTVVRVDSITETST